MPAPGYPRGYAYPDYIERDKAIAERDEARRALNDLTLNYEQQRDRLNEARYWAKRMKRERDDAQDAYQHYHKAWADAVRERGEMERKCQHIG